MRMQEAAGQQEKTRILHILPIPILPLIGPCLRTLRQSRGALRNGCEVAVLCRKGGRGKNSEEAFLRDAPLFRDIVTLPDLPTFPVIAVREIMHLMFSWRVILRTIRRFRPDVVHVHNYPVTIAFVTTIICSLKRLPVVLDVHDGWYESFSSIPADSLAQRLYFAVGLFFEKISLRYCSAIITVSEALKKSIREREAKATCGKPFDVMRNVDPRDLLAADPGAHAEENILVYSGVLYFPYIGLEDLMDIMPHLHQRLGLKLVVIGDGPYRKKFEAYAAAHDLKGIVEFTGHIGRNRLHAWVSRAKLCVIPFQKNVQLDVAVPNKLFEYMAFGKAIVYPDLSGFSEIFGASTEGRFSAGDKRDLQNVIDALASNDALRRRIGQANRKLLEQFSFEREYQKLQSIYLRVLRT